MADVLVVGTGICGASAAHFLAQRGREVLVLDRGGVSEGTTGRGEGNVLVSDKLPGIERDMTVLGRELWGELGERFPAARVTAKGALLLDHPDGEAGDELEPALATGIRCLLDPGDLQVDPAGLARSMLSTLTVRTGVAVTGVEPGAVTTASGERLEARHVVVATGPWAAELTGLPVQPRKGQLVALTAPPGLIRHKLIEAAYVAAAASGEPGRMIASVIEQTLDGDEVLVGSSRERVGFDDRISEEVTQAMIDRAARFVPALAQLPVRRAWCGFRPWLPDGLPAVGPLGDDACGDPARAGLWTSCGHEGSGVALGPVSGLLLAQLICGEAPVCDPVPVDPRRFAP
ncbi:MAG TPA: FAD-dependent oxidoreductase [Solirubrobacteraceae bacterium]|nr:FAD-dependent oxidoreductase [Solirubrobacteraceae bacterium]